jgi:hypothetical protein
MGKFFFSHLNGLGSAPSQHVECGSQDAGPGQVGGDQSLFHNGADQPIKHPIKGKWFSRTADPHRPSQQLNHKGSPHASQQVLPEAGGGGGLRQFGLQGGDRLLQDPHAGPQPDVVGDEILQGVIYVK